MQASDSDKVSVIIPNYNGGAYVFKCVESILSQTYRNIEVLVVDNASTDGSEKNVTKNYPQVRLLSTGYNAGWGNACNAGMKAASGHYIALINNDAYLDTNCIQEMVNAINLNPKYGSCASRILLWGEPDKTEVSGLVIYKDGSSCGRGRLGPADQYMKTEEVFCANDCCCLYKRAMIEDIGDYDPDFFIYCDETDMGWRHQLAGWKCIYSPKAVAYHAHSITAGSYSAFKAYHVERNRIFICIKYFPMWHLVASFFYAAYRYLAQVYVAFFERRGALAHYQKENSIGAGFLIIVKAHWHALLKLPTMWRRRKHIRNHLTRITSTEFLNLFKRFGISAAALARYE